MTPFICRDLSFVTDFPNQGEKNRKVFPAIVEAIRTTRSTIMAESPYFVIKDGGMNVLKDIQKRQIQLMVLTNGLFSTDADYAVAALDWRLSSLAETGLQLYAFRGSAVPGQSSEMDSRAVRWGLHSKRAVLDGKHTLIGTYNIDPRSANLNSELLIICKDNPELARAVLKSMEFRKSLSRVVIDEQGQVHDSALTEGGRWTQKIRYLIVFPIANLFDFLL
jgi:putative cardiolipin synthase